MKLVIDVGNTDVVFGIYKGNKLKNSIRLRSNAVLNANFNINDLMFLKEYDIKEGIISSVVPLLKDKISKFIKDIFNIKLIEVTYNSKLSFNILTDNPKEVGNDLLSLSEGAIRTVKDKNYIIVDLGTATKIIAIKDKNFIGCSIMPGIGLSTQSLNEKTAQLPYIENLDLTKAIGTNTIDCLTSGILLGHYYAIIGLVKEFEKEMNVKPTVIVTGGYSNRIIKLIDFNYIYNKDLILEGLYFIHEMNKEK